MHIKTIFGACAPYRRLIYWIASSISQGKKNPGPGLAYTRGVGFCYTCHCAVFVTAKLLLHEQVWSTCNDNNFSFIRVTTGHEEFGHLAAGLPHPLHTSCNMLCFLSLVLHLSSHPPHSLLFVWYFWHSPVFSWLLESLCKRGIQLHVVS